MHPTKKINICERHFLSWLGTTQMIKNTCKKYQENRWCWPFVYNGVRRGNHNMDDKKLQWISMVTSYWQKWIGKLPDGGWECWLSIIVTVCVSILTQCTKVIRNGIANIFLRWGKNCTCLRTHQCCTKVLPMQVTQKSHKYKNKGLKQQ